MRPHLALYKNCVLAANNQWRPVVPSWERKKKISYIYLTGPLSIAFRFVAFISCFRCFVALPAPGWQARDEAKLN